MNLPPSLDHAIETICLVAFGMLSGWLGYIMRTFNEGGKIVWVRSFIEAAASGIVGYISILICSALHLTFEWTGVVVGVLGWLGATASMRVLEAFVYRRLGVTPKRRKGDGSDTNRN